MLILRGKQREITLTEQDLIDFESEVVNQFEQGKIRGAVHLSNNNEKQLIDIFQYINSDDWVFSTWRNHYHALLHGVSKEELMREILNSHSISFQSPKHHFYTSAIVNGILPIAVGTAMGLKWNNSERVVFCFVGDMTSESGVFYECLKYSIRNNLPIHFVIEDNGLSTNTPTQEAWGTEGNLVIWDKNYEKYITKYSYVRGKYPHVGAGKFIHF
jgi:pyruvate dehydrogenase E1 component alpha subunit